EEGQGVGSRAAALIRLLQAVVDAVRKVDPTGVEPVMHDLASAVGQLSPEMIVSLLAAGARGTEVSGSAAPQPAAIVDEVVDRMSDSTIAGFVARNAMLPDSSLERVAHAFQTLVRETDARERLLALAHDEARSSPLGTTEGFEEVWDQVAQKMMTTYSDKPFVSDQYARELTSLTAPRTQVIDVDQVNDDPPERLAGWLATVATNELRALDLTLVSDLLRIEEKNERWSTLMRPVVALIDDLLLVGDVDAAATLVEILVKASKESPSAERRQTALIAIDVLVAGALMQHIVSHLATLSEEQFERVKTMCVAIGEVLIRPLAEALTNEDRTRPRERLTAILITFGAVGRREVERLKNSPNAAVRRTAIYLLREFGGSEALPELTELLNDRETHVQREAIRAILNIGTDQAFEILRQAITTGSPSARDAIMHSLSTIRDERATPLFVHILEHVDHRGEMAVLYLRSVEALGALKAPAAIPALKHALHRGEWWAPGRTAPIRAAAVAALQLMNTTEAQQVLDEGLRSGPRRVRSAIRAQLNRRPGGR
ncbi:MAG TPA: HEAT repeat domain-containing protein, partial [Vicinamibacterales bacterium]|nr:HEAT repeat domain-containing protein [Vicinamibacterales bacterium]